MVVPVDDDDNFGDDICIHNKCTFIISILCMAPYIVYFVLGENYVLQNGNYADICFTMILGNGILTFLAYGSILCASMLNPYKRGYANRFAGVPGFLAICWLAKVGFNISQIINIYDCRAPSVYCDKPKDNYTNIKLTSRTRPIDAIPNEMKILMHIVPITAFMDIIMFAAIMCADINSTDQKLYDRDQQKLRRQRLRQICK